jgi:catechol 2,3-dioxygenase
MASDPIDLRDLVAEGDRDGGSWTGLPAGTRIGHMHLQVGDLRQAEDFYHGLLGFDIMAAMPGALFLSAGGYHHHLGLNTWHSRGGPPSPPDAAGLRSFTLSLPDEAARQRVVARLEAAGIPVEYQADAVTLRDPWHTGIRLTAGTE